MPAVRIFWQKCYCILTKEIEVQSNIFFKDLFMLKIRVRDFLLSSVLPVWLQRLGLGQSEARGPKLGLGLPCSCGVKLFGHLLLLFPGYFWGWIRSGAARTWTHVRCWHRRWPFYPLCHSTGPTGWLLSCWKLPCFVLVCKCNQS